MFGKKDKPQHILRVSILTDEYLIDAMDDPVLSVLQAAFDSEIEDPTGGAIELTDARVQPMGKVKTPVRNFDNWRMPSFIKIIAMWSDDPAAEEVLQESWEDYQTPFKAIIYAGAYVIEGTVYSDDDDPPMFDLRTFIPLKDAKITHQLDDKTDVIRARWGVLNSNLMHGFSIEK